MNPFARFPFLRFFLPLVAGIVWQQTAPLPAALIFSGWIGSFIFLFMYALSTQVRKQYSLRYAVGVTLQAFWFFSGSCFTSGRDEHQRSNHYSAIPGAQYLHVQLIDVPSQGEKSSRCEAKVLQVFSDGAWHISAGHILLNAIPAENLKSCFYGDELIVPARYSEIEGPRNPGEFNYRRYMHFRNISHRIMLQAGNVVVMPFNQAFSLQRKVLECREWLLDVLRMYIPQTGEQGVAAALLFGYKEGLDKSVTDAYARTGTLHVLAVSGMHVAIIFWVANALLSPFRKVPGMKWTSALLIIGLIWFYSLLSGMAPSIVRASVMFTCIVLGRTLVQDMSIFNNLFASACLLLCYDPWFLFDAGFQLSYLAVLGIVIFQPAMEHIITFKHRFSRQIWNLLTVSVAAQVATFPVSLYYFHQFPNLFFIANLIIIPLTTCIMYAGIALIVLAPVAPLAALLGALLQKLIAFADATAEYIQALPYSVTENIGFTATEAMLLYAILVLGIAAMQFQKVYLTRATVLMVVIFMVYNGIHHSRNNHQSMLVLQSVKAHFAAHIVDGTKAYFIADSTLLQNAGLQKRHFQSFRDVNGIASPAPVSSNGILHEQGVYYNGSLLLTPSHTLLFLDGKPMPSFYNGLSYSHVVLRHTCRTPLQVIRQQYHFNTLILDASLPEYQRRRYRTEAEEAGIPYIDLMKDGALSMPL